MKKAIITISITLFVLMGFSTTGLTDVSIGIGISLPPAIVFSGPPEVVVIPDTYVYAAPGVDADLFFYHGYWWRPWKGHWYRSRDYRRGWILVSIVPYELTRIPPYWRESYRDHHWRGREWHYERIPHHELRRNWWRWERQRHWDKSRFRQTRYPDGRNFGHRDEYRDDDWYEHRNRGRDDYRYDDSDRRGDDDRYDDRDRKRDDDRYEDRYRRGDDDRYGDRYKDRDDGRNERGGRGRGRGR